MPVRVRLVVASALMLFTELMLIRWLGANLLNLAYFSNIVLLGSFLGIGLGFLMAKPGRRSPWWFPASLAALVVLVVVAPDGIDRSGSDLIYFTAIQTSSGFPPVVTLGIVFAAVALVMTGPGLLTAQCFLELPRLDAYRWDLVGSLIGTRIVAMLSTVFLAVFFTCFLFYTGTQMLLNFKPKASRTLPGTAGLFVAGMVVGFLSAMVGAGGGFFSVPFLSWCNVPVHTAIGTSAALGFPIAVFTTIGNVMNGWNVPNVPQPSLGADLKRFYRLADQRKLAYIERLGA